MIEEHNTWALLTLSEFFGLCEPGQGEERGFFRWLISGMTLDNKFWGGGGGGGGLPGNSPLTN